MLFPLIKLPMPMLKSPVILLSFLTAFFFFKGLHFFLIYLFMAVLGLCFCARAFSSCGKRGPLFIAVRGPLTIMASLVAKHRLQTRRLSNHGSWAQLLHGMWDLPRQGSNPCLLHWQADSQPLRHQGSPNGLFFTVLFVSPSACHTRFPANCFNG